MLEVSPDIWWSVKMRLSMGRDSNIRPRPQHRYCFKRSTTRSVTTRSVTRNIYCNTVYLWQFLLRDTIPAEKILNSSFHTTHATLEYAQRNASVVCSQMSTWVLSCLVICHRCHPRSPLNIQTLSKFRANTILAQKN